MRNFGHANTVSRCAAAFWLASSLAAFGPSGCAGEPDEERLDTEDRADELAVDNGTYTIVGVQSGKCLDIAGIGMENGAKALQWDCWGGDNQKFSLRDVGGDHYEIKAIHSGRCLEVGGVSPANGAVVQQWDCWGGDNQRWRVVPSGNSEFSLVAKNSGKCLDVRDFNRNNGAIMQQWECSGNPNQKFRLNGVGGGGGGGNPLTSAPFFVDPSSQAVNAERSLRAQGNNGDADLLRKISTNAAGVWIGEWSGDVTSAVRATVGAAGNQIALLIAYNMYHRDCGGFSSGGAPSPDAYRQWIDGFTNGLGSSKAIVILEPDALPQACDNEHYDLMHYAIGALKRAPNAYVYVDAGHSAWLAPGEAANRLRRVGVDRADGFSVNVSNFRTTGESATWGRQVSDAIGGKPFVIDTARNGRGPLGTEWCNPGGRGLGERPTTNTGDARIHAYLWAKKPGESDGTCNGGPPAGQWFQSYALELARNAVF